jgi:hypothetical protein
LKALHYLVYFTPLAVRVVYRRAYNVHNFMR